MSDRINWTVGYHVRSCDGVTIDFTLDIAAARKIAFTERAAIFRVNRVTGHAVRTV